MSRDGSAMTTFWVSGQDAVCQLCARESVTSFIFVQVRVSERSRGGETRGGERERTCVSCVCLFICLHAYVRVSFSQGCKKSRSEWRRELKGWECELLSACFDEGHGPVLASSIKPNIARREILRDILA